MKKKLALLLAAIAGFSASVNAFVTDTLSIEAPKYLPEAMKVTVITPDSPKPEAGYPTVYLLNGFGGD